MKQVGYSGGTIQRRLHATLGIPEGIPRTSYWMQAPLSLSYWQRRAVRRHLRARQGETRVELRRIGFLRNEGIKIYTDWTDAATMYSICLSYLDIDIRIGAQMSELMPEIEELLRKLAP